MVHFVGAGPGDKELITVKGMHLLQKADVVIYAGSLVNPKLLEYTKKEAEIFNSASMTLEEVVAVMERAESNGKMTVRLHTGDPSVYGAHREQMDWLERLGISYDITPGVSSFLAAAASLKKEYTLPGVSQTVILTRMEGRTSVPEKEQLEVLAKHNATMLIFLSAGQTEKAAKRLIAGGYRKDTPAAVVYKASWEDEKIVTGTLENIGQKAEEAGIKKTALIAVGDFLGDQYQLSKLYDKYFTHEFRNGISE
ncbi:precorrin-4 C(11)-methyltransferase [Lachnoclostridium edouardi]|uniref:precorrin-4 C(11)-methyltransferase n=1 Tax=Lachnoclostridium edouardi TaxID=1926283 RepID=UPI000C79C875|nr:precorrin-4 C(11)-methyltransferase [Lachnoclostridium edouardi]